MNKLLIATAMLLTTVSTNAQQSLLNSKTFSLLQAYEGYLKAVKAHNYEAVTSYFTKTNSLPFVSGKGEFNSNFNEHLKGQKAWLNDKSWTYESELKSIQEFESSGVIIESIVLHYSKNNEKWNYNVMATYVFVKEDGMWRMVTDVCSAIL